MERVDIPGILTRAGPYVESPLYEVEIRVGYCHGTGTFWTSLGWHSAAGIGGSGVFILDALCDGTSKEQNGLVLLSQEGQQVPTD